MTPLTASGPAPQSSPTAPNISTDLKTPPPSPLRSLGFCTFVGILALLGGCATPPPPAKEAAGPLVYPLPPDPPRIQYLATLDRATSVAAGRSGLADFVLGDDKKGEALMRPYGAALFEGKLFVADSRAPGIAAFDLVARKYSLFSGTGGGKMQQPINITIDADGTKYVTDTGRNQILVFARDDRFVTGFGEKGELKPVDTAIAGERLYVVDIQNHQVVVLDKRSGKRLFTFGKPGSAPGSLYHPTNLALGPEGDVFVTDTGNFRISRFTADGKFVRTYGEAGQSPGTFARPKGIAVDRAGRLYVGDAAFQNVQIFNGEGRVLMAFGQPWDGTQGLNLPAGVSIDYDNVAHFRRYAAPDFTIEYLILVVSQFGPNKVDVFGFGRKQGITYPSDDGPAAPKAR